MASSISIPVPNLSALKLSGAKTYLVAAAAVVYALYGYFTGHLDAQTAAGFLAGGAGGASLRAAVAKAIVYVQAHQTELAEVRSLIVALQQAQAARAALLQTVVSAPAVAPSSVAVGMPGYPAA